MDILCAVCSVVPATAFISSSPKLYGRRLQRPFMALNNFTHPSTDVRYGVRIFDQLQFLIPYVHFRRGWFHTRAVHVNTWHKSIQFFPQISPIVNHLNQSYRS
ncbi:hypothetical protein WA026_007458 [Henosepilachna vigintioctopunctata]|uniref:Secreted protein n=1 Tax=Henosepilachna vigintioctopunctata TaxID=420089 RepID=A0AAW1UP80_9CUCU